MRTLFGTLIVFIFVGALSGQTPLKVIHDQPFVDPKPIVVAHQPGSRQGTQRQLNHWSAESIPYKGSHNTLVASYAIENSGSFWIAFRQNDLLNARATLKEVLGNVFQIRETSETQPIDWIVRNRHEDQMGTEHIRVQQSLAGIPIKGQDLVLHKDHENLTSVNGFAWTGQVPANMPEAMPSEAAFQKVKSYLLEQEVSFQEAKSQIIGFPETEDHADLIWYPLNGTLTLAYVVDMHPNRMDHWTVYVDAGTLDILQAQSELCSLAPLQLYDQPLLNKPEPVEVNLKNLLPLMPALVLDGPTMVNDQDLNGQTRLVNAYAIGSTFFMIDASRAMFQGSQSVLPDEPVGTIWTLDALNSSPQQSNFQVVHTANTNNDWKNLEVSAHYNGGEAYEYFRQTFNRNSINGSGGNILSIINVTDENDNDMDNAFWNGAAMFYGNGDVAFNAPLAKALDVAGHEMSHGVIQNTANLEYVGQSGALNESYADIFGVMIDRDDWQIAESVANPGVFPSGAIRDMSNPNNGATGPGKPGWQPKHMNEFQNLPNTVQGDNGGVHVNSGIPNKAFFLLATEIGKNKAEKIYYKALTDYLVKSSQFVDMRNAAERAAKDIHGNESAEVIAVRNAFAGVGIGAGQGGDYEEDIEVNGGDDFVFATDENESDLYWIPPGNPGQFIKMEVPAPISKPSFTDDGSACVYVDNENNMIVINFDWSQGLSYQTFYLENNPQGIWRNVVVSKDGTKIAYTTANLRNQILIFDFDSGTGDFFELFNPTTSTGGVGTGDVLYPDAMEWDYSGEFVMYDALNRIESQFGGGIEYWDISFLHAWDNGGNTIGSGQVGKLFSALPENISVGNASFAKNSPYIIVFDHLEEYYDIFGQQQTEYKIKAANIQKGEINDIYTNTTVGYPDYSRLDDKILFTYNNNGSLLLATIDVQPTNKIVPIAGTDVILINGAQKGVWIASGNRIFTSTEELNPRINALLVKPNPVTDILSLTGENLEGALDIEIVDMTGTSLLKEKIDWKDQIQVEKLIPGIYTLRVKQSNGRIHYAKFVKQ